MVCSGNMVPLLDEGGLVLFWLRGREQCKWMGSPSFPHYKYSRNHVGESLLNIALADEYHMRLQPTIISLFSEFVLCSMELFRSCLYSNFVSFRFVSSTPCNHSLSTLGVALHEWLLYKYPLTEDLTLPLLFHPVSVPAKKNYGGFFRWKRQWSRDVLRNI